MRHAPDWPSPSTPSPPIEGEGVQSHRHGVLLGRLRLFHLGEQEITRDSTHRPVFVFLDDERRHQDDHVARVANDTPASRRDRRVGLGPPFFLLRQKKHGVVGQTRPYRLWPTVLLLRQKKPESGGPRPTLRPPFFSCEKTDSGGPRPTLRCETRRNHRPVVIN